eukprot:1899517-Rhodomonas_salina.1
MGDRLSSIVCGRVVVPCQAIPQKRLSSAEGTRGREGGRREKRIGRRNKGGGNGRREPERRKLLITEAPPSTMTLAPSLASGADMEVQCAKAMADLEYLRSERL